MMMLVVVVVLVFERLSKKLLCNSSQSSMAVLLVLFLMLLITMATPTYAMMRPFLHSPCPDVFEYRTDPNGVLYGAIQVSSTTNNRNIIQINIELSVGNSVGDDNGRIKLVKSKDQVVDDILHNRPIQYNIFFPPWIRIAPKITKILVNGNLICSGPRVPMGGGVIILTTINLVHTLTLNAGPLQSQSNNDKNNNFFDIKNIEDNLTLPPNFNINFNPQLPDSNSQNVQSNPFSNFSTNTNNINPANPFLNGQAHIFTIPPTPPPPPPVVMTTSEKATIASRDTPKIAGNCGLSIGTNHLIVHGSSVTRGAFPWVIALFVVKPTGLEYKCGGSLISARHVVTAAHCVTNNNRKRLPQDVLIVLGKQNIQKWTLGDGEKIIDAFEVHVHEDYSPQTSDADIAVIVLSENIKFTNYIRPVCLWTETNNDLNAIVGDNGRVVGWGRDENGQIMTTEPKLTIMPIVGQEECLRSSSSFQFITSQRTFCAGFQNGSGPCNGDSGSGFILNRNGRWVLRGVVSMSISDTEKRTCDLSNFVVFTDASKFLVWLLSFIK